MTAAEKAKELVETFAETILPLIIGNIMERDWGTAKQCALTTVDEIVNALTAYGETTHELQNMDREFAYWENVKQEIQEL